MVDPRYWCCSLTRVCNITMIEIIAALTPIHCDKNNQSIVMSFLKDSAALRGQILASASSAVIGWSGTAKESKVCKRHPGQ